MIDELRQLIVDAAPEPELAQGVLACSPDDRLDEVMPFSSLIVLGAIVAVEERYGFRVTREMWTRRVGGEPTLRRLATLIEEERR